MDIMLVDTGAFIALLDRSDAKHTWATRVFRALRPPLYTCEAVVTEALHLLSRSRPGRDALANLFTSGVVRIGFNFEDESAAVWQLLKKYVDTPMDFADACLVRMAELNPLTRVWTVDSDFFVYRCHGRQTIPLLFP
jgi:predicted nucleic acid-binding protein